MDGLSNSDVALLADRNDGMFSGGNAFFWVFALLLLNNGGFGGWGGNNSGLVSQADLAASQNAQTQQIQMQGISNQIAQNQFDLAQVIHEQTDTEDYITFAMEVRAMDASFGKQFADMSAMELDHATKLFKMFEQYYSQAAKAFTEIPEHMSKIQKEITEKYMKGYAKVRALHDAYNK